MQAHPAFMQLACRWPSSFFKMYPKVVQGQNARIRSGPKPIKLTCSGQLAYLFTYTH